jgi:hypothetical protein
LERQDLTGLVGAASGGRPLPPEVAMRHTTPLVLVSDQRRERLWVTPVERFGCCAKLIDHCSSMPRKLASTHARAHCRAPLFRGVSEREGVTPQDVERFRFLGSPSVRVNGHDVEPGAGPSRSRAARMKRPRVYRGSRRGSGCVPR